MAQSQQETRITGDAAQFLQEVGKVITKSKEHEAALKKLTGETKKLTNEEKKLAREAKRVYDETRTPQERHTRKMEELNRLVRKGAIDQQTYRRAVRQSQQQLDGAGKAGQRAFGPAALTQLKNYAAGFLSVSAGIGIVIRGLRQLQEERKALAQSLVQTELSAGALATLTGGDAQKTARLQAAGLQIYGAGGARTPQEAMNVAFNLQSAGLLKERGFVSRLAAIAGEEGIVQLVGKAGKLQKAFGKEEAGSLVDIFSKATGAAGPLPEVNPSQMLQATTEAVGSGIAMGLSDEELFAAVSRVAIPYSPAEASTAVKRMLDQLAVKRPELKGQGLVNIIETLKSEQMTDAQLKTLLQIRGVKAFRELKDVGALRETLGTVEQAQQDKAIMKVTRGAEESPLVFAPRQKRIEEAREWLGRLREGMEENMWEAQQARMRSYQREVMAPDQMLNPEIGLLTERAMTAVEGTLFGPRMAGKRWMGELPEDERAEWREKWEKLDKGADALERAAESLERTARARPVQENN